MSRLAEHAHVPRASLYTFEEIVEAWQLFIAQKTKDAYISAVTKMHYVEPSMTEYNTIRDYAETFWEAHCAPRLSAQSPEHAEMQVVNAMHGGVAAHTGDVSATHAAAHGVATHGVVAHAAAHGVATHGVVTHAAAHGVATHGVVAHAAAHGVATHGVVTHADNVAVQVNGPAIAPNNEDVINVVEDDDMLDLNNFGNVPVSPLPEFDFSAFFSELLD